MICPSPWWRHEMETFSALLAIWAGNSPVPGEFPSQRPVTRSFDIFFDLRLNQRLSKQSWGWWFETLPGPLWRHCNVPCSHWNVNTIRWGTTMLRYWRWNFQLWLILIKSEWNLQQIVSEIHNIILLINSMSLVLAKFVISVNKLVWTYCNLWRLFEIKRKPPSM